MFNPKSAIRNPQFLLPLAAPTQEETLRSIGQSLDGQVDPARLLAVVLALVGLVVLLIVLGLRSQRRAVPRPLNSHPKLLRAVMRETGLTAAEVRQLRALADHVAADGSTPPGPLTLLLCPSLIAKAMQTAPASVDRPVLGELVAKMRE